MHAIIAVAVVVAFAAGVFVGYKYAKSKFAAGVQTVVTDIKKTI